MLLRDRRPTLWPMNSRPRSEANRLTACNGTGRGQRSVCMYFPAAAEPSAIGEHVRSCTEVTRGSMSEDTCAHLWIPLVQTAAASADRGWDRQLTGGL